MDGHCDRDGRAIIGAIGCACGKPNLTAHRLPWRAVTLASPFVRFGRQAPTRFTTRRDLGALRTRKPGVSLSFVRARSNGFRSKIHTYE
jgi:hypothetical protein